MKKLFYLLLSLPKTIYLNFKVFNFKQALKLPVFISNNVKIKQIYKGCIKIEAPITRFMIKIGLGGSQAIVSKKGLLFLNKEGNSKLVFNGKATFSSGVTIFSNGGEIFFGDSFSCNKNCFFDCNSRLVFGEDVLIGWDVNIRDSDGHKITPSSNKTPDIIIGNHVWICSCADVLKSTEIGDNSIVAYRSCCTGIKYASNVLVGGYPAKILKENVNWEH